MKKAKYLVLSTALATMLLGAGYAAWTDDFSVSNRIEAGELKVTVTAASEMYDATFYNNSMKGLKDNTDMQENSNDSEHDLVRGEEKTVTVENNTVNFDFENMYPGTHLKTNVTALNEGTLPAVIDSVDVTFDEYWKGASPSDAAGIKLDDYITVDYNFDIINKNGTVRESKSGRNILLGNLKEELNNDLKGLYLLPGEELATAGDPFDEDGTEESLGYNLTFNISEDLGGESGDEGENEQLDVNLKFNFVQHNMYGKVSEGEPR